MIAKFTSDDGSFLQAKVFSKRLPVHHAVQGPRMTKHGLTLLQCDKTISTRPKNLGKNDTVILTLNNPHLLALHHEGVKYSNIIIMNNNMRSAYNYPRNRHFRK